MRARSSQPLSVRRSPSKKAAVMGKKMTSTAITTLELIPKPNHSTSSGARAKTGTAWLSSSRGMSQRCSRGRNTSVSASPAPSSVPIARPSTISARVVSVLQNSSGAWPTMARATEPGLGSM